eukprot:2048377-Ditylum_brightwellii.AAC.1
MTTTEPTRLWKTKKKQKKLTWEAKLNIHADKLVSQALSDIIHITPAKTIFYYLPHTKVYLTIDNKPILGHINHAVTTSWTLPDLLKHLHRKYGWTKAMFQTIDHSKLSQ